MGPLGQEIQGYRELFWTRLMPVFLLGGVAAAAHDQYDQNFIHPRKENLHSIDIVLGDPNAEELDTVTTVPAILEDRLDRARFLISTAFPDAEDPDWIVEVDPSEVTPEEESVILEDEQITHNELAYIKHDPQLRETRAAIQAVPEASQNLREAQADLEERIDQLGFVEKVAGVVALAGTLKVAHMVHRRTTRE
jgi:hypothetical protein